MRLVRGDQAPAHQGEQGEAELRLGVVQDLADRGLRNMQCARGGADRSSRVDGVEDFNLAESHGRSDEHTSALQSLLRRPYAEFCLKTKHKNSTSNSIRLT